MKPISILVLNTDSTNLKFELFEKHAIDTIKSIIHGKVSDIGGQSAFEWGNDSVNANIHIKVSDLKDATDWVLDWLENLWPLGSLLADLKIVAHHCVNCTTLNASPVLIADEYQHGRPVMFMPKPDCVIGRSRKRFADDVEIIVVLNIKCGNNGLKDVHEEAAIAEMAWQAAGSTSH